MGHSNGFAHKRGYLSRTFKLSNDRLFAEKAEDIVGFYLNPPAQALLLSVDEKCQVQALDRTQPGLPIRKGRSGTMTHDYKGCGTTTLFAALSTLDSKVIYLPAKTSASRMVEIPPPDRQATPQEKELHLIMDNYSARKHPQVQAWLKSHPRFTTREAASKVMNGLRMEINQESYRRKRRNVSISVLIVHFLETVLYNEADPYSQSMTDKIKDLS